MQTSESEPHPEVLTAQGALRGRVWGECDAFLGVPFAAPPVAGRRFAPPMPPDSWIGVRPATEFGFAAPQPDRPMGLALHGPTPATSEDCLTLNIWRPSGIGEKLPAVLWLHGGGWALGFGSQGATHGARLASNARCVVVTTNYRLGSLGWLHHSDLAGDVDQAAGNWGLLDQVAALRWLHQNADAFGIDATSITVAGHSAGALAVLNLLVAPAAKGLFQRAVVQSGPMLEATIDADEAASWALQLSESLGATGFDQRILREAPVDAVIEAHERMHKQPPWKGSHGGAVPCLEPATLPTRIAEAPLASSDVAVLIGHTAQEGTFRMLANATLELDRETIDRGTRERFAEPIGAWSSARAAGGGTVHRYQVDQPALDPRLGATHGVEIPLIFGTYDTDPAARALVGHSAAVAGVSAAMMKAWSGFIGSGDPGWAPIDSDAGSQAVFGGSNDMRIEAINDSIERNA